MLRPGLMALMSPGVLGVSGIASLLSRADLNLSNLYYSAIPVRGAVTPSMTRATVQTRLNDCGKMVTLLAGELGFPGARRVRNLLAGSTIDFSNTSWIKTGTCAAIAGGFSFPAELDTVRQSMVPAAIGNKYMMSFTVSGSGTITLRADNTENVDHTITLTSTPTTYTYVGAATSSPINYYLIRRAGNTATAVTLSSPSVVDVTAETDQTTAREYVSVGALDYRSTQDPLFYSTPGTAGHYASTPNAAAHAITGDIDIDFDASSTDWASGANDQIIGNYDTAAGLSGWRVLKVAANTLRFDFRNATTGTTTTIAGPSTAANITGVRYRYRFKRVGAAYTWLQSTDNGSSWTTLVGPTVGTAGAIVASIYPLIIANDNFGTSFMMALSMHSARVYSGDRDAGGTLAVDFNPHRDATTPTGTITSSTTGEVWTLNGASSVVRSAAYHGSMVDGVKCFPTDLSGNRLTGMTTPLIELAGTQILATADIRDMTTANWTLGATMTRARTSVGADGAANSATRLTGGAVAATNTCYLTLTAAASSRTYSAYVKRVTGTGPVRIVQTGTETDISAQLNTAGYARVQLNASVLNVAIGFKIDTDGDAIDVDYNQFESGPAATSPMITTGAARAADQFLYAGALLGTLKSLAVLDFKRESGFANVAAIAALSDGTLNEYVAPTLQSATVMQFQIVDGGVLQVGTSASNAYTPGTLSSAAQSFATNDIKMAKDGVAQPPDTVATIPTVDRFEYGMVAGAFQFNGCPGIPYGWVPLLSQSQLGAVAA